MYRPVVAIASLSWVGLIIAAPVLPAMASALLYALGSVLCHQIADRSFHLQSYQLPVCARCFGLYAGGAAGSIVAALTMWGSPGESTRAIGRRAALVTTAVAALPTALTFALEWIAGWPVGNLTRALAGAPLGMTVAFVVAASLGGLHYDECAPQRPTAPGRPPHSPNI